MEQYSIRIVSLLLVVFSLSCSMEKRKYTKGFYFHHHQRNYSTDASGSHAADNSSMDNKPMEPNETDGMKTELNLVKNEDAGPIKKREEKNDSEISVLIVDYPTGFQTENRVEIRNTLAPKSDKKIENIQSKEELKKVIKRNRLLRGVGIFLLFSLIGIIPLIIAGKRMKKLKELYPGWYEEILKEEFQMVLNRAFVFALISTVFILGVPILIILDLTIGLTFLDLAIGIAILVFLGCFTICLFAILPRAIAGISEDATKQEKNKLLFAKIIQKIVILIIAAGIVIGLLL